MERRPSARNLHYCFSTTFSLSLSLSPYLLSAPLLFSVSMCYFSFGFHSLMHSAESFSIFSGHPPLFQHCLPHFSFLLLASCILSSCIHSPFSFISISSVFSLYLPALSPLRLSFISISSCLCGVRRGFHADVAVHESTPGLM